MATMDVEVTLRLLDELTGPAKAAAASLKSLIESLNQLQGMSKDAGGKGGLGGGLMGGMAGMAGEMKAMQDQMKAMAETAKAMSSETRASVKGVGEAFAGIPKEVMAATKAMVDGMNQMKEASTRMQREAKDAAESTARASRAAGEATMLGAGGGGRHGGSRHGPGHFSSGDAVMAGIGLQGLGHHITHTIAHAAKEASELQRQETNLRLLGLTPERQAQAKSAAFQASAAVKQFTPAEELETFGEARYAFANEDMAKQALIPTSKFMASMRGKFGSEKASALQNQMYAAFKTPELLNQFHSMDEYNNFLNAMSASANASQGIISPEKMFSAAKYGRGAPLTYDKEFREQMMPELTQELSSGAKGGSGGGRGGAGPSFNAFDRYFVQQTLAAKNIPQLLKMGLVDPEKVKYDKKGNPVGFSDPHAFYDQDLAARNPFQYTQKDILPGLARTGVDINDPVATRMGIAGMGGTQNMQQMVEIMAIQREQLKTRMQQQLDSMKTDATYNERSGNLDLAEQAVGAQGRSMLANLGKPFLPLASGVLNRAAGAMSGVVQATGPDGNNIPSWAVGAGAGLAGVGALKAAPWLLGSAAGRTAVGGLAGMAMGGMPGAIIGGQMAPALAGLVGPLEAIGRAAGPAGLALSTVVPALQAMHEATKDQAGMTLAERAKAQGGGSVADVMHKHFQDMLSEDKIKAAGFTPAPQKPFPTEAPKEAAPVATQLAAQTVQAQTSIQTQVKAGQIDASGIGQQAQQAAQQAVQNISANGTANVKLSVGSVDTGGLQAAVQAKAQAAVHDVQVHANVNVSTSTTGGGGGGGGGGGNATAGPPKLARGGHIMREGLAYLHSGEEVVPAQRVAALRGGGGGGGNVHVAAMTIHVHGGNNNPQKIAEMVHDRMMRTAEAKLSDMGFMTS